MDISAIPIKSDHATGSFSDFKMPMRGGLTLRLTFRSRRGKLSAKATIKISQNAECKAREAVRHWCFVRHKVHDLTMSKSII